MSTTTERGFSIRRVTGEVMLHDGQSGWVQARSGMSFHAGFEVTVKTGSTGTAEVINARGELIRIPPRSLKVVSGGFSEDDIDTLRNFRITARDIMAARVPTRQTVAPAY